MRRKYLPGIILSLAIILCIVLATGACLASSGGLPLPPLPPATLPQPAGPSPVSTPAASPVGAPQGQQDSTACNTVSMDQFYIQPSPMPVTTTINNSSAEVDNTNITLPEPIRQAGMQEPALENPSNMANNATYAEQPGNNQQSINSLAGNLIGRLLTLFIG